jgi:outer membrane protein OmpA-like peptidoglycan-associated protein
MKFIDPDGMDGILWTPKAAEVLPEVTAEPVGPSAQARVLMGGAVVGLVAAGLSFGLAAWWSGASRPAATVEHDAGASAAVAQVAPAQPAVAAVAKAGAPAAPPIADPAVSAAQADAAATAGAEAAAKAADAAAKAADAAAKDAAAKDAAAKEAASKDAAAKEAAAKDAAVKEAAAKEAAAKEAAAKDAAAKEAAAKDAAAKAAAQAAKATKPASAGGVLGSARFGWDSAVLSSSSAAALVKAAGACSGTLVISGHTCDIGDPAYNLDLSRRRAAAVAAALAAAGVPQSRLDVRGEGAAAPSGSEARRDSRRVDITCVGGSR